MTTTADRQRRVADEVGEADVEMALRSHGTKDQLACRLLYMSDPRQNCIISTLDEIEIVARESAMADSLKTLGCDVNVLD